MAVSKSALVWSIHDLDPSPSFTVGDMFTVDGAPDLMSFVDGGLINEYPNGTDGSGVDYDQDYSGTLNGTSIDSRMVFEAGLLVQDTQGNQFWIYHIHDTTGNNVTQGYVAEQPLVQGETYTVQQVDLRPNYDDGSANDATVYFDDFTDGVVEGTGGDDVITAASGYTDLDGEQIDGGDGLGTASNDETVVGGAGSDTIAAGAGNDVVFGDHAPDTDLANGQTDFVVSGYFKGDNLHLTADHFNSEGATQFVVDTAPTSIRFVDSDSILDTDGTGAANELIDPSESGLVEIDGQLYSYVADYQQTFDGSDGNEYTFILVDVDLNGDGTTSVHTDDTGIMSLPGSDEHFEDGQILLPVGTPPPAGTTLTSQGSGTFTLVPEGVVDYTTLDGYEAGGSTYDDSIAGGGGNDTLIGGLGDDSVDGGNGADLIAGDDISPFFATDPDALIWTPPSTVHFSYATGDNLGNGVAGGGNHATDVASSAVSDLQVFLPTSDLNITSGDTIGFSFTDEDGQTITVQNATVQQSAFSTGSDNTGVVSAQGADQFGNQVAVLIKLTDNNGNPNSPINAGASFFDNDTGGGITNGTDVTLSSANATSTYSGDGNDTLRGGIGADTLLGGGGDDSLEGQAGADVIEGGDGTDWASYESSNAAVTVSLAPGQANNETGGIHAEGGHATGDTLTGIENLQGSDFNDVLEGDDGANEINGGAGDDTLYGVTGDDTIRGGAGNDEIDGGWGHDFIEAGDNDDHVVGSRGDDFISGNDGDDHLEGGRDDDTLTGNTGNDTLNGGREDDLLFGGDGDDVFEYLTTGFGHDTVSDFGTGNSGEIDDGDQTNNDFVDLSEIYSWDNYYAAVTAGDIDPGVIRNPLQWMQADQADDGVLNDENAFGTGNSLTLNNGGAAVAAADLTFDNTNVLCFTRGSHIATVRGEVAVENLKVGDLVITRDNGYQAIRWIGSTRREATGKVAPVLFRKGALGNHTDLMVSPNHRMLLTGAMAELVSGDYEVLAAAKFMVNNQDVLRVEGGVVEYFHILFDNHEIVLAEGCWSESFHPGRVGMDTLSEQSRKEILDLFPELGSDLNLDATVTARQVLDRRQTMIASALDF